MREKLLNRQSNILRDFSEEYRRDVFANMKWNGCGTTILVSVLTMRAALTNLNEPKRFKDGNNFSWLQNWDGAHVYATRTR
jgi:hypothetical protein